MSIVPKNNKETKPKVGRRRRKKRRTEDFSDDSSDDSSSSNESDKGEDDSVIKSTAVEAAVSSKDTIKEEDIVLSDSELPDQVSTNQQKLQQQQQKGEDFSKVSTRLKTVNLTKTPLNETTQLSKANLANISKTLTEQSNDLQNSYLNLMFENFGDDINELRKVPDFNEKNLIILANVLKNGANVFDQDTLKAITN
ncbi:hypothetical protein WICPIJ_005808 [Wickerhamomyces pijperi]|uniref:Ribosome assembly protein 3 n=1 Tax=Wickerhamomyces pijperi TaxID=599730 RepID=A0A9P8Q2V0_WICPI|nr:hypothetical protein WICPIJ_005808 [Wickerhamomyces pijperi]